LNTLRDDLRGAVRQMFKSPGFAAVAIITLALAIGANTAVFSVIDAVLLRPLPYDHPERLIEAESVNSKTGQATAISYPDFFDWRAQNRTLDHLVSYHDTQFTLLGTAEPLRVDGEITSSDLLPALGVAPELGRGFTRDEEKRGSRVILISHALWQSHFGSDRSVLGRTVNLSGDLYTIIGVMPASFRFPVTDPQTGIWTTLALDDDPNDPHPAIGNRGSHFLNAIGKLKPGVTVAQASQDLHAIARNLAKQYPETNTRHGEARAESELSALVGDTRTALCVVLGAVVLVLIIACGNIANLLLARMRERQREFAMRSALGAGRARLLRQLLVESVLLSAVGGLAGCGLAYLCTPALLSLIGDSVPRAADAGVDLRVLTFSMAVSLAAGIIFGIVPALTASRTNLLAALKEGARTEASGHDRFRSSLIVGQVALGLILTAGAGLLITSFLNLRHTHIGFDPDHLLTLYFETPDTKYLKTRPQFYGPYFERVRALPGVQSAAGIDLLPMTDNSATISFEDPEHPMPKGQEPSAFLTPVTPQYFRTMRIPLLEGRDFNERDTMSSPLVMIVNRAFVDTYFPGQNVLGKRLGPGAASNPDGARPMREIVGVAGNIRLRPTDREERPMMYLANDQLPKWCCLYTVVRSSVDPLSLESSIRQIVSSLDKDIPVTQVRTMNELVSLELAQPRFAMVLLGSFAGLALVLTVVGLYGVMMYAVTRRTREIGVRMALGAQRVTVLGMILRDAARLLALGVGIGVAVTLLSSSILSSMLYGTGSRNPVVLAVVCIAMAAAGLLAAYLPAMRAASIEPMEALRRE
jgi:putative ABC transport system permease protein